MSSSPASRAAAAMSQADGDEPPRRQILVAMGERVELDRREALLGRPTDRGDDLVGRFRLQRETCSPDPGRGYGRRGAPRPAPRAPCLSGPKEPDRSRRPRPPADLPRNGRARYARCQRWLDRKGSAPTSSGVSSSSTARYALRIAPARRLAKSRDPRYRWSTRTERVRPRQLGGRRRALSTDSIFMDPPVSSPVAETVAGRRPAHARTRLVAPWHGLSHVASVTCRWVFGCSLLTVVWRVFGVASRLAELKPYNSHRREAAADRKLV